MNEPTGFIEMVTQHPLSAQDVINQKNDVRFSSKQLRNPEDAFAVPPPYCFEIEGQNNILIYTGGTHLGHYDDVDKQKMSEDFKSEIVRRWESFLNHGSKKKVAVIEGGIIPKPEWQQFLSDTESSTEMRFQIAQEKWGEVGIVTMLAEQESIEVVSPEPQIELEVQTLVKELDEKELKLYYFIRQAVQFHRDNPGLSVDEFRTTFGDDVKYDELLSIYESLLSETFDFNDFSKLNELTNPIKSSVDSTIVNKVAKASSDFRDRYLVSRMQDLWNLEFSMFVVFGSKHAASQEPAIMTFNGIIQRKKIEDQEAGNIVVDG